MTKFGNPTSVGDLIKNRASGNKPRPIWFPVLNQVEGSVHRFEIIEKKYNTGKGIRYLIARCIQSPDINNLNKHLQIDRDSAIVDRSGFAALLSIDVHIGGNFAIEYRPNKHRVPVAYLIADPGE